MPYVELHCHSNFSLLDGASPPEALVERAAELKMPALALTDHDAVYGAVRFARAARAAGIQPILGAELSLVGGHHLTVLVENQAGWPNLCELISQARHKAPKGAAALPPEAVPGRTGGLIALSGCRHGEIAAALRRKDRATAWQIAGRYRDLFGPANFWLELQHHLGPEDALLVDELVELAEYLGVGYVATNNVHYAHRTGSRLQDVLVCIRHQVRLDEAGPLLRRNSEYYLKAAAQLRPLFARYPAALTNTVGLAERCQFTLQYGLQDLPRFPTPANLTAAAYLQQLCETALPRRYPSLPARAGEQLRYELAVIEQAGLSNYFLIVWDIMRFAAERGIRGQGRGSAANSIVAYLLQISPVDPLAHGLVFERFLSTDQAQAPDIDLDFEAPAKREEVIQYLRGRYGEEHAALACTSVTFHQRSALRDIAKVLGIAGPLLRRAADQLAGLETPAADQSEPGPLGILLDLCRQIRGYPRHLGIHNGGLVLTGSPLASRVPIEPATTINRTVVQWDKDSLEEVGLIKIDILGLRMLAALADTVKLIAATGGAAPDLDRLAFDDPAVYRMISAADTLGVFQVESRAQAQLLPKLQPRCFEDLIIAVSLIRPGPIQGNMVRPYLRRRLGQEPVTYPHPLLQAALADTLGVIIYQEQVLKVARDLAGFTPGQGEQLRRALGGKRGAAEIERFRHIFLAGAQARGVPADVADTVFDQLRAFGSYAFPKSHAAAFAVLVYQSAWLKCYYPVHFLCALLNNQPLGFWGPATLIGDARRRGLAIRPVDLQHSQSRCTIERDGIRLGFNYVAGFGQASITRLVTTRPAGQFTGLLDFCRRTRLPRRLVAQLIRAGAMAGWGTPRRRLLWELGSLAYQEEELELVWPTEEIELPALSRAEAVAWEYEVVGLSPGDHLLALYRSRLAERGILGSADLAAQPQGQQVTVAGLVVVHQAPPTAKNFHFLTLEDETNLIDVIVRPHIYTRYRRLLHTAPLLLIRGTVQRENGVVNILAQQVDELNF